MPPDRLAALLAAATARLTAAGSGTPTLDARLLLQAAAGLTREDLILGPDRALTEEKLARFDSFIARRERHEPVSRILGEREFYGRVFRVTPDTLDPRPDTETLIEAALPLLPKSGRLLDLGAGTGAIAITLLAERPDATGIATDLSAAALAVARENAARLGVACRLTFAEGSWFAPVSGSFDIILSNPPYIPDRDIACLSPDVRNHDPDLALSGGADGLGPYRIIATGAAAHLAAAGHVLVEIGAGQAEDVEAIFAQSGFRSVGRRRDLGGHTRCLVFVCSQK
ncbi:peptide chain release factor N(5)-glutamine methyltransferase [Aestuariivirga sp.]|uniref:peptide chain release factor N(5)-glutamine methyltransferase n=1 Tax=Aestuariivirga sp. TaxID=2650926 RepID=UPI0025BBEF45|nr:peptide chain release factor N(5)-glutamine methyltransferase [Aestuariivirga sp.]MCA3555253.1 peptide chain release factor N(5)-glutamine methyltransferase [Aestuariivirga sp.]